MKRHVKQHPQAKKDRLQVRLGPRQRAQLQAAAAWISERRGEIVAEGTLLRELVQQPLADLYRQVEQDIAA